MSASGVQPAYFRLFDSEDSDDPDSCIYVWYSDEAFVHREHWALWCRQHSIDASEVLVPGWIRRDRERYRVEYLSVALNENGRPYLVDDEIATETRYVQLEGKPLPFPDAALDWANALDFPPRPAGEQPAKETS